MFDKVRDFRLSGFSTIDIGPLEDIESLESNLSSSDEEVLSELPPIEEDIWTSPREDQDFCTQLRTWPGFHGKPSHECRATFASDKNAQHFDSILATQNDNDGNAMASKPVFDSLIQLCLGRESTFFVFVAEDDSFALRIDDGRMSGLSRPSFQSLCSTFFRQGNTTRNLHSFASRHQRCEKISPTLMAIATAVTTLLEQLECQFMDASHNFNSLLQIQDLSRAQTGVLEHLMDIKNQAGHLEKEHAVLSLLFDVAQKTEHSSLDIREASLRILIAASAPWEAAVNHSLGLVPNALAQSAFGEKSLDVFPQIPIAVEAEMTSMDELHALGFPKVPNFISRTESIMIFELMQNIGLLRAHSPQHPILNLARFTKSSDVKIAWRTSWNSVEGMVEQIKDYKLKVEKATKAFDLGESLHESLEARAEVVPTNDIFSPTYKSSAMQYMHDSTARIEAYPGTSSRNDRFELSLFQPLLREMSDASAIEPFSPPVSLLPSLSFSPVIAAQAGLVNRACLRLLFEDGGLRRHLATLSRFKMLSDGVFSSRLCHSLFNQQSRDDETYTKRHRFAAPGLGLGYRNAWPPMSSELRLAVRGILTDSYFGPDQSARTSMFREELPGGLSFAIAELDEKELSRCTNPDSVYALDFLRLQYQAPSPVAAVITPASLIKYDAIFKLILRAKRMVFVVEQLAADIFAQRLSSNPQERLYLRFRQQAHHFVSSICTYFFESMATHRQRLDNRLAATEAALDHDDLSGDSIAELRRFHGCVLDGIMFSLLLRKRQSEVLQLLEDIFGIILQFAGSIRKSKSWNGNTEKTDRPSPTELYQSFQKKAKVFVAVCRGLSERKTPKDTMENKEFPTVGSAGESETGSISQLLLRFEMNGFYAK